MTNVPMRSSAAVAAVEAARPARPADRTGAAMPRAMRRVLALDDLEGLARRRLPRPIFGYIAGASETGWSFRANREAFQDYHLLPRVLVDASNRTPARSLFGRHHAAPFGIAPMGVACLAAYQADIVMARAAAEANIPFILSGASLVPLEQVAAASPAAWFQSYLSGDPKHFIPMVDRVASAGFDTFVLTVDVPVLGNRENNIRNGFNMPLRPSLRLAWDGITRPRWLVSTCARTLLRHGMPHIENLAAERGVPIVSRTIERAYARRDNLAWTHVEAIRRRWKGRMILKGILRADDARRAREIGMDGVVVSNHGGRQLDGAIAPLHALPEIRQAAGEMAVMIDGGVRRGTDVLKALALGADFVFVGRPFLFAAAVAAQPGVARAIDLLREEIDRDMVMLGIDSLDELTPDFLRRND